MRELENFVDILTGNFDNKAQFDKMQKEGKTEFPFARHVNTVCNNKIKNMPEGFEGIFIVEESYYTVKGNTHSSPHIFLFTQEGEKIKLTSYDLPEGYGKSDFTYDKMGDVEFADLKASAKFTPAYYTLKDGVWEGGSVSMFTPMLKFTLFERFYGDTLEVSETMEMNSKRIMGYDEPIIYKRIK